MATNVVQMVLKLTDKASPSLKKTGDAAGSADTKFSKLTTSATKAGLGLAAVGVAAVAMTRSIIAMGQEVADKVNLITDMSVSTGLAVESLENLQLMARGTGVSIQGMERGFVTFARNLADARDGIGPLSEAMSDLGFDANQFGDTDEAFRAVMEAISGVTDKAEQARLMNDAFGMSSKDLAKAMQMQFGEAGKTLDEMGLRIGDSAESASQAQRGLALYELVLDKIKRAAFEAFLGGGGFAQGLSIVVGVAKGLGTLLVNIKEFTVGLFLAVAKGIYSMQLLIQGELEKSNQAAKEAQAEMIRYGGALVSVLTGEFIKDAVDGASDFQKGLNLLGQEVKADADLLAELDKAQKKVADSAGEAGEASGQMAETMAESFGLLRGATLDFATAMTEAAGKDLSAVIDPGEIYETIVPLQKVKAIIREVGDSGSQDIAGILQFMSALARESHSAAGMLTEVQAALLSDDAPDVIEEVAIAYERMASRTEAGLFQGFESDAENIQHLRENLASLLLAQKELIRIGGEAFAVEAEPFIESLRAAIEAAEEELLNNRVEFKAAVDEQSLIDIRNSIAEGISLGASTMQSLAGGDVAGAAGGIAAAAQASPMVGAVISAIGALAEIGQMTVKEIKQNTRAFVDNLANGIKVVVKALPEVIKILLQNLPAALIEAAFTWIPMLVYTLPMAIMEGFVNGFKSIMSLLGEAIREAFRVFDNDSGGIRKTPPEETESSYTGPDTSYYTGTASVARTGRALVHRGETIIPAGGREAQSQMGRMGGASVNINISTAVLDRDVIPRLVREIDRAVGTYGRTSAAFAGG